MYSAPTECPVCHDNLLATRMVCRNCGTAVEGRFSLGRLFELTPEQVRYAFSDVTLLLPLMVRLQGMLKREGRDGLARECSAVIPTISRLDVLGYLDLFEH